MDQTINTIDVCPARPRVRFIPTCFLRTDPLAIAVTVAAFCFVGIPVLAVLLSWMHSTSFAHHPWAIPISIAICFVVGGGIVLVAGARMHLRKRSWNRDRIARLETLLERPGARNRLPHRFIELHHYTAVEKSNSMTKHLAKLPPGEVIVAGCPPGDEAWRIVPSNANFEPIPWESREERMVHLLTEFSNSGDFSRPQNPLRTATKRSRLRRMGLGLFHIYLMAIGMRTLIRSLNSGRMDWVWLIVAAMVILAIAAFKSLVIGRRFFLVPGGLVQLETGLLYRTPRVELFTPTNATLMVYESGGGFLASQGQVRVLQGDSVMMQGLLAAWRSAARTPTMAELQTLLVAEIPASRTTAVDAR